MATETKSKYLLTHDMSHQDWLRARQQGIGGSDAGAVLGLSDFRTQYDVWEEKIAPIPIEVEENERMEWGKRHEEAVAQAWQEKTGMNVHRDNKMRFHPTIPYLLVNLDRVIIAPDDRGTGVLEVKTADEWTIKNWDGGIPLYYYAQCQHELLVTGYKWGEMAILFGKHTFRRYAFEYDTQFWDTGLAIYDDFWNNHVIPRIPPAPKTNSDLKKAYPWGEESTEKLVTADLTETLAQAVYLKGLATSFAKDRDIKYLELKTFMGNAEYLVGVNKDTLQREIVATYRGGKPKGPELCPKCGFEIKPAPKHGSRRFNLKKGDQNDDDGRN